MKLGWGKAMPKNPFVNAQTGYLTIENIAPGLQEQSHALLANPTLPKVHVNAPQSETERNIIDCVSRLVASVSIISEYARR